METATQLDDRLVRALREGAGALPEDLARLCGYLGMIDALLAEKAGECEPSWALAGAAAAEVETLQALEAAVAERAIEVRAADLGAVLAKLQIWRALSDGAVDGEPSSPRDRLILSVESDLERLARVERGAV